ncbi:MAG TPA: Holliday junction branch migration protein RuvA [Candidatus Woesebacteria bacterium]|nr:Holliday junction branch migration protein RuvA [Candidatus Woesebacteria bacterium]HOG37685.1 Holliday junction branch migration protein RuvA [Candidatus Woesebacteria bacterium]
MISSLKGKINRMWGNNCEVEVGGVGYCIWVGRNFVKKHNQGEEVTVSTYMAVSENEINLFGFENWEEVDLFKMLISVSGVGPKTAAGILGEAESEAVVRAIGEADVDFFQKIKGIGKKTAQRIIIDLKSKIGGLGELDLTGDDKKTEPDEVFLSLKQLGFERKEIEKVIAKLPKEIIVIEEKIQWCLGNI